MSMRAGMEAGGAFEYAKALPSPAAKSTLKTKYQRTSRLPPAPRRSLICGPPANVMLRPWSCCAICTARERRFVWLRTTNGMPITPRAPCIFLTGEPLNETVGHSEGV